MRYVGIDRLSAGMKVGKDIMQSSNFIPLIRKNAILTEESINILKRYQINGIYIDDEISKGIEIEEILPITLQSKAIDSLKNLDINGTIESAREIVDIILSLKNLSFDMIGSFNKDVYQHSITVCEFAVAIGRALGYNKYDLVDLATASLLHDIGVMFENNQNKLKELNISSTYKTLCHINGDVNDYDYKRHPLYAMGILENNMQVKPKVKQAIFYHHENEDGTGFPTGKKSEEIGEFAQIIHICDEYDRLLSMAQNGAKYSPSEAYEYVMGGVGSKFNTKVFDAFMKHIPVYPKGVTVELSNGYTAIVLENNIDNPLRPKLMIEPNGPSINLMMPILKNVTIIGTRIYDENEIKNNKKI